MKSSFDKLLATVETIAARPDVWVISKEIGPPVSKDVVARKQGILPDDLLAFFAEVGRINFRYKFRDDPQVGGGIDFAGLTAKSAFEANDPDFNFPSTLEHFAVAYMPDDVVVHCVRKVGEPLARVRVVAADPAEEADAREVAPDFSSFLDGAAKVGFATGWPLRNPLVKKVQARLAKRAVAPVGIAEGARVSETLRGGSYNRGVVVALAKSTDGAEFARVRFDHGAEMWCKLSSLKVVKQDPYEAALSDVSGFFRKLIAVPNAERVRALQPIVLKVRSFTAWTLECNPALSASQRKKLVGWLKEPTVTIADLGPRFLALIRPLPPERVGDSCTFFSDPIHARACHEPMVAPLEGPVNASGVRRTRDFRRTFAPELHVRVERVGRSGHCEIAGRQPADDGALVIGRSAGPGARRDIGSARRACAETARCCPCP